MNYSLNRKNIDSIICFLIILLPFIRYYDIPLIGISSETFVLLLLFCLSIIHYFVSINKSSNRKALIKSRYYFLLFSLWFYLVTIMYEIATEINIYHQYSEYSINTFIMLLPIILVFCTILSDKFDTTQFIRIYKIFVFTVIMVYIIQYLLKFFGITLSFKLPFFPYNSSWNYLSELTFGTSNSGRPVSLFSEPAHMCEFLLPSLVILLFTDKNKKKYLMAGFITLIIISTVSGNGIIGALIVWVVYFLYYGKMGIGKRVSIIVFGCLAIFVIYYFVLIRIPIFKNMFNQLFINNTGNIYNGTKADFRIYRGFDYFSQLPLLQKITGIGYQHMHAFAYEYGISSVYDSVNMTFEFFSTITQVLLYSGLLGGVLFYKHLKELFSLKIVSVQAMIILSVSIWFSSQMLFANTHLLYIALIVTLSQSYANRY